ncbi:hypothetical protein ACX12M_14140 [Cellulosimicrobium cellulans]
MTLFLDDPDEGLSPATSHPAFVSLAPEPFYDEGEDLAPFGNDSGHDALRDLEEWYAADGRDDALPAFVDGLLAAWDLGVPEDVWASGRQGVADRLRGGDVDEAALAAEARAQIAIVLGQLKIRGGLIPHARALGVAVLDVLAALNDHARVVSPGWRHADADAAATAAMAAVVRAAPDLP